MLLRELQGGQRGGKKDESKLQKKHITIILIIPFSKSAECALRLLFEASFRDRKKQKKKRVPREAFRLFSFFGEKCFCGLRMCLRLLFILRNLTEIDFFYREEALFFLKYI